MKIRSITLDNIRRFTDAVKVGPIGDGVTLLCEPNEAGKSTLFDALHALFFQPHRSTKAEVKSLQPHSKGKIAVECEFSHDGSEWRIRKEWLSGQSAKVWREGTLVHQGDAAEDWIAALVSGDAGGPGGLLWVRQGRVSLKAPDKKSDAEQELSERRDLLTAISGAMDDVTGGERMDRARDRVDTDLRVYETPTGRPTGRWKEAESQVEALTAEKAELEALVDRLRDDLDTRRRYRDRLKELEDPELAKTRREDLAAAEEALRDAEGRAKELGAAEARARLAEQEAKAARADADRSSTLRNDAAEAEKALAKSQERHRLATDKAEKARRALEDAKAALASLVQTRKDAEKILRQVDEAERAAANTAERQRLAASLEKAEAAESARIAAKAAASRGPDARAVNNIEALTQDLEAKVRARDAAAPRVSARYTPGAAQVLVAGAPLAEGEARPLSPDGLIDVPGVGSLTVSVSDEGTADAVAQAQAALAEALASGPWENLSDVREAARLRSEAEREETLATERRNLHAPDGIDALREQLALLGEAVPAPAEDLPTRDEVVEALDAVTAKLVDAEAEAGRAQELSSAAGIEAARTEEAQATARQTFDKATAAVAGLGDDDPAELAARLEALDRAAAEARAEFEKIQGAAPDVGSLRARRDRLKRIIEEAAAEVTRLKTDVGTLDGRIEARGDEGVEEQLAEVSGRLETAKGSLARIEFEVKVLRRLRDALDAAKMAARDTYFEPIKAEMQPLLRDLWDDVDIEWSDDTLLPARLVRRGTAEPIDILSGGTQEQIAFFVRLAFARLLAKAGRPAPLILDDALVYSDDDRIEKMFDALHRAAGDLQIIVLSCRQRAFRDLGAPSLTFERVEAS